MGGISHTQVVERRVVGLEQLHLTCASDRLTAAGDLEFAKDGIGVRFDGADGDNQHPCNLRVGLAARYQPQYLQLTQAQPLAPWFIKRSREGRLGGAEAHLPSATSRRIPLSH